LRSPMTRALAAILIFSLISGLQPAGVALGSVEKPKALQIYGPPPALAEPGKLAAESAKAEKAQKAADRRISSFYARVKQEILAKFRPIERDDPIDFDAAEKMLSSKTTLEKIFNDDFEKKMRAEYASKVLPFEATATNPIWRARHWEQKRYEEGRNSLAKWTAREVLDDQLKEFLHGGDSDSAPMKVLSTARELSGGGDDKAEPALTEKEKAARAHRRDLPVAAAEEETIATKLRTKINVLKQHGSLVFQNPVATATVNGSREDVTANINKEFRKLTLRSALNFGVKASELNFNVNKKITDEVSLDFDHYSYTGGKKGAAGESSREQARVNYSLSF